MTPLTTGAPTSGATTSGHHVPGWMTLAIACVAQFMVWYP
jgi:hypothetical protein